MTDAIRFDCIVVLGHSADEGDPVTEARVRLAADLYREGVAPCLVLSGKWSFRLRQAPPSRTEGSIMRELALGLGVPAADVLIEDESTDTLSNAYFTRVRFVDPLDWRRICVVTSDVHAERALWLFAKVFGRRYHIEVRQAANATPEADLREGHERNARLLRQAQTLLEGIADGDRDAISDLLFTRHPGHAEDPALTRDVEAALL